MKNHKDIDPYGEEIWEDDIPTLDHYQQGNNNYIVTLYNETYNVKIENNNNYNRLLPYDYRKTLIFENDNDKLKFLLKFECGKKKIRDLYLEKYDKNGLILYRENLYGVLLTSINFQNKDIEIRCDFNTEIFY